MPLVIILSILAIVLLRSVPVTANFKTQLSIFKSKHTWFMTLFYYGTFATFAGLGAHFALMGDTIFSNVAGAPSAIAFAWVGPAIGALARVGAGKVSDKIRGGRVTTIMVAATIIGLVSSASTNLIPLQVAGSGWQLCGGCLLDRVRQCINNPTNGSTFPARSRWSRRWVDFSNRSIWSFHYWHAPCCNKPSCDVYRNGRYLHCHPCTQYRIL